jgi:hypothetical protein
MFLTWILIKLFCMCVMLCAALMEAQILFSLITYYLFSSFYSPFFFSFFTCPHKKGDEDLN